MGEEKLIIEQSAPRREEGGYLEKLAKAIFPPVSRPSPTKAEIGRLESSVKLKKLESEHLAKINIYTTKISRLNEDREKLKSAIEILKELNLNVPEEYNIKKRSMQEEVEALEEEVEREKMLLNYLQSKILPLIK